MDLQITPKKLSGAVTPPSSKSQAHRLLIAAALSGGISVIHGLADSQDIRATRRCLSAMCAGMEDLPDGTLRVHGLGNGIVIAPPYALLDCGESGSTLRFLIPVGLLIQGEASFTGRGRLMERPLKPYEDLFREKGIAWKLADNVLTVNGGRGYGTLALDPGTYRLPGPSSARPPRAVSRAAVVESRSLSFIRSRAAFTNRVVPERAAAITARGGSRSGHPETSISVSPGRASRQ